MIRHSSVEQQSFDVNDLPQHSGPDILAALRYAGMPQREHVIIGGANLVLRGIIESTPDIDMLVSDKLFQRLVLADGTKLITPSAYDISRGVVDSMLLIQPSEESVPICAATQFRSNRFSMNFATYSGKVDKVDGHPCLRLKYVIESKRAVRRPKDITHLEAIAKFTGKTIDLPVPCY